MMKSYSQILLIDEGDYNDTLLGSILRLSKDYLQYNNLQCFKNGDEALQWLKSYLYAHHKLPELIFVNLEVADSEGVKIIESIASLELFGDFKSKIVAILNDSPQPDSSLLDELRSMNIVDYVVLPLTLKKIDNVLR